MTVATSSELQWPSQIIKDLLNRHPAVALNVIRDLEARLREMEGRLRDLWHRPVEQRIAHALSKLALKFGAATPDGVEIPFPLKVVKIWPILQELRCTPSAGPSEPGKRKR